MLSVGITPVPRHPNAGACQSRHTEKKRKRCVGYGPNVFAFLMLGLPLVQYTTGAVPFSQLLTHL